MMSTIKGMVLAAMILSLRKVCAWVPVLCVSIMSSVKSASQEKEKQGMQCTVQCLKGSAPVRQFVNLQIAPMTKYSISGIRQILKTMTINNMKTTVLKLFSIATNRETSAGMRILLRGSSNRFAPEIANLGRQQHNRPHQTLKETVHIQAHNNIACKAAFHNPPLVTPPSTPMPSLSGVPPATQLDSPWETGTTGASAHSPLRHHTLPSSSRDRRHRTQKPGCPDQGPGADTSDWMLCDKSRLAWP